MECARGAVDRHRMSDAAMPGDRRLKRRNRRALGEVSRAQHVDDSVDVRLINALASVGDH
jgi:hypothetical protein